MSGWGLVRKKRWPGVEALTETDKEQIKKALERWSANKLRPNPKDVETLFSHYNRLVYHTPNDRQCGGCVQFIYNYWKDWVGRLESGKA